MRTEPVLTYQNEDELGRILELYRSRQPKRVLEVGSAYGGTLYEWLKQAAPGTTVVSVDLGDERMVNHALWRSWVPEGVTLHLIVGDSRLAETIAATRLICPEFDWAFIDGDHSYETVKQDWQHYGAMVVKGGVVVFDDVKHNPDPAAGSMVDELWLEIVAGAEAGGYRTEEIFHDTTQNGNGLGVVYK